MKNNNKGLFIGIAVIAVIIIAGIAAMAAGGNKSSTLAPMGDSMQKQATTSGGDAKTPNAVEADSVAISNFMFNAPAIKVKVGTTVTWTNMDSVKHNVVADKPSADAPNGPLIAKGTTFTFTFKKAGTYTYHCDPHPYMKGTVVVTE